MLEASSVSQVWSVSHTTHRALLAAQMSLVGAYFWFSSSKW